MSQPRQGSCGGRRISALLFSLLSRVGGWLDAWRSRRQARRADAAAAQGTSRLAFEALEPRLLLSADLVAGSLSHNAFDPALPGDPVGALFEIHRPDSEPLGGPVRIQLYASTDSSLDAADTPVGQTDVPASQLQPGANTISLSLDTRAVAEPGRYALIGVIDPNDRIGESDEGNNQAIANQDFNLAFRVGQLPGRNPVPAIEFADADGTRVTLAISGPGIADLSADGTGYRLTISGSDASTRVELTGSGGDGRVVLSGISAASALGSLNAAIASLEGAATFAAAGSLVLGDIAAGARIDGNSLASLSVTRDALGDLRLAGGGVSGFVLGSAQVGGAIGGLWSIGGRGNSVSAQTTRADWRANFSAPLTQLAVRGNASGQFAASALQILQVGGSLRGMAVRIGANLGSDAILGGNGDAADRFGPGTLARLRISGDIEDSTIVVGIDPRNGTYLDGDDQQLGTPTQRVQELLVGGQIKGSTQIVAPAFPASVRVGGATVNPANLAQLSTSTPDAIPPVLTANLVHDTGADTSDQLTNDPTIHGQATDAGGIRRLLVALDATSPTLFDVSHTLQADGRFVLADTLLDALAGGRLGDGAQTIRLLAEDTAGNRSAAMTVSFTLDRAVATPGLQLALDSGRDNHDRITHTGMLDIAGSEAGASLEYSIDAGVSWTPDFTAAEGDNSVAVLQTDRAGNVSLSGTLAFVLDTFAPAPPGIDLLASSDSGLLTDDNLTRDTTPTLALTSEAGTMITLRRGTTVVAGSLPGPQADFTSEVLADGEAHFFAISEDLAGNRSVAGELLITIDTIVPTLTLALANDTGHSAGDGLTSDATVRGTLSDDRGVTILSGGFGTDLASFAGLFDLVQPDGTFTIDAGRLAPILGVPPADGPYTLRLHAEDAAGNARDAAFAFVLDTQAPSLTAALANDTGRNASDGVTRVASIAGAASDASRIVGLRAGFGDLPAAFADILDTLQPDGHFALDTARLSAIHGPALPDGAHTLRIQATDDAGNMTVLKAVAFNLDTTSPGVPVYDLSASSDSGASGDGITTARVVTLVGAAEEGATLTLAPLGLTALAGGGGVFQFASVALADGANSFRLIATDAAGNTSVVAERTLTREGSLASDVVSEWHGETLATLVRDAEAPPAVARTLAIESLAVFDVVNAFEGTPAFLVALVAPAGASLDAAIAGAAHRVLVSLYPAQRMQLDARLASSLAAIADGTAKNDGLAFGRLLADAILAIRAGDGYKDFVDYPGSTDPGDWRPSAPNFELAALPQWASVTPFVLTSAAALRPVAPPGLDSAEYAAGLEEVRRLGSAASTTRTAEQTETAHFWADGLGTPTPGGHWNQIAARIADQQGLSAGARARLFAELNVALSDASVAAWDAKYFYGLWRPETAIAEAGADGNDTTQSEANWRPLLITPNHPEYVSGHSTYSAAAAAVLERVFGENFAFDTTSPGLPGVTRHFASFGQAAQEAGRSRIYGGIHYEFTNQAGQQLGREVAAAVLARFALHEDSAGPVIVLETTPAVTRDNVTFRGRVLDNLSGATSLEANLDGGGFRPLAFDGAGVFSLTTAFALDGSADGEHTLELQARDAAGNPSGLNTRSLTLDTRAPALALGSPAADAPLTAASRLQGVADPNGSRLVALSYSLDAGTPTPLIFDAASGAFDQPLALRDLPFGNHILTLRALDAAGNESTLARSVRVDALAPFTVTATSPIAGAEDVGATYRPQIFFSRAVNAATLTADTFYATDTTGAKLAANIVVGDGGNFAWLFFTNPMPGASIITVHLAASEIRAAAGGEALDADGDGTPEADFSFRFSTVNLASVPGTILRGRVVDPGDDLEPMTFDDLRRGPDGVPYTGDDIDLHPLANVEVFILGRPDLHTFTDAAGFFELTDTPVGNVKVVVNGRTASNAPGGFFFPEMTMDLTLEAGRVNTMMGSMGARERMAANEERLQVYLPRLEQAILRPVDNTQRQTITLDPESAHNLTPEQIGQLRLEFEPGSLIGDDGQPLANAQIGISVVPPELVRDMMPPGIARHGFDITIQAPGVAAFATPLPISFPNDLGLPPGTKANLLSFDHTTGRLEVRGSMTVSKDGTMVVSDPGTGVTQPGWHWWLSNSNGSGGCSPPPPSSSASSSSTFTLKSFFLTGDTGGVTIDDIRLDAPAGSTGSGGSSCPVGGPSKAYTLSSDGPLLDFVTVTVDGSPIDKNKAGLPYKVTLRPGDAAKIVRFTPKSYDEMAKATWNKSFAQLERDMLYGAAVKLEIVDDPGGGGSVTSSEGTGYVYRWVDVVDAFAAAQKTGATAVFHKMSTQVPQSPSAPPVRWKTVDVDLPTTVHTGFRENSFDFGVGQPVIGKTEARWSFAPSAEGLSTTNFEIVIQEDGTVIGSLEARGTGTGQVRLSVNIDDFKKELKRVILSLNDVILEDGRDDVLGTSDDIKAPIYDYTKHKTVLVKTYSTQRFLGPDKMFGHAGIDDDNDGTIDNDSEFGASGSDDFEAYVKNDLKYEKLDYEVVAGTSDLAGFMPRDRGDAGPDGLDNTPDDRFTPTQLVELDNRIDSISAAMLQATVENFAVFGSKIAIQERDAGADITVDWGDVFRGGQVGKPVLGQAKPDPGPGDHGFAQYIDLLSSTSPIGDVARQWLFAEKLNSRKDGTVEVAVGAVLGLSWPASGTQVPTPATAYADIIAHEVAHTLGLVDGYSWTGNLAPVSDMMAAPSAPYIDQQFEMISMQTIRAALGIHDNLDLPLTDELLNYKTRFYLPETSPPGLPSEVQGPDPQPVLAIHVENTPLVIGQTIDFGLTAADGIAGQQSTLEFSLSNVGTAPLTVDSITLSREADDSGFALSNVLPLTLGPGETQRLDLRYDPSQTGTGYGVLSIRSNTLSMAVAEFVLRGEAISAGPSARLSSDDANLGGLAVGSTMGRPELFTIENRGMSSLLISAIRLADGDTDFQLIGVPIDLASTPISLAYGEGFSFGASFDPSTLGLRRRVIEVVTNDPTQPILRLGVLGTGVKETPRSQWGNEYVAIEFPGLANATTLRTRSDASGNFQIWIPQNEAYHQVVFDPETGLVAHGYGRANAAGERTDLSGTLVFAASTAPDTDFDGLPDDIEFAIGTSSSSSDSDRDGLSDFAEWDMDSDPLDGRSLPAGVLAVTSLLGEAKEVVLAGRTDGARGQIAYVATGSHGLAIVDSPNLLKPIVVGQLNLPGDAVDVSLDSRLSLAAVATGVSLEVVDVSNSNAPRVARSIPVAAGQIEVVDGVAYVALGSAIESYNLLTGERLNSVPAGAGNIVGLAADRGFLFAADSAGRLAAVDIGGATMVPVGAIDLPASSGKVFVGGGIAYVGGGASGGFVTVDVSNPGAMVLLSGADSTAIAVAAVVATGSGDALTLGTSRGEPVLYLADVRDPTRTNRIVDRFRLPSSAYSAAVGSGLAFVAGGTTGLVVVNYRPFDTAGQKPIVTASVPGADIDPATDGTQVLEGTTLDLEVVVQDDRQIARVELLVDGQVVVSDVSYPWSGSVVLPKIKGTDDTVSIQLRAVDTGGNVGLSAPIELQLVRDTVAPVLIGSNVPDGAVKGSTFRVVTLEFSEALDARTVTPTTVLLSDSSGAVIAAQDIRLRRDGVELQITYPALAAGTYQLRLVASAISDRAGNQLGATDLVSGLTVGQTHTAEWIGGSSAMWDDPANWSSGILPGPGDDVVIDVGSGGLIYHRSGATTIRSLTVNGSLQLAGGKLELTNDSSISGAFTLNGGTLAGAGTLTLAGTGNRWHDGTMTGSGMTRVAAGADLLVTGRLGALTLADRSILNDGTIVVDRGGSGKVTIQSNGAAVIRNLGTFEFAGPANIGNAAAPVGGQRFENLGLLRVRAAASIALDLSNAGTVELSAAATLNLSGAGAGISRGALVVADTATLALTGRYRFENTASASGGGRIDLGSSGRVAMAGGSFDVTVALADGAELSVEAPTTIRFLEMTGGTISGTGPLTLTLPQSELLGGTVTVLLVEPPDAVRPAILHSSVVDGATYGPDLGGITLDFSEPMRPDRLVPASFFLLNEAGQRIEPLSVSMGGRFGSVTLEMPRLANGRYRLVAAGPNLEDHRAGNRLADGDLTIASFRTELPSLFDGALYATGRETLSAVLGDVDGDGDLDIVTASYSSASVLLGNGDGTFAPRVPYALPGRTRSVALGDVDGDGDLDIVTANSTSSSASVLLGNGDGTFAPRVDYAVPFAAASVALGDVDGDDNLDIVTASRASPIASVLLGSGDGTFAPRVDYALPQADWVALALGDVNGDGDLDIVTAGHDQYNSFSSASVLLGHGAGSFAPRVDYALPSGARSVALGDVDGDHALDIVTANDSSASVSVLRGNGDGTYAPRVDYTLPVGARSVALGDVNGDGDLDIVTASYSALALVLLGRGDGTFAPPVDYALPFGSGSVKLGDVDGDDDLDIVTTNDPSASILLGNGDGSFAAREDYAFQWGAESVALGDVDGDGSRDIVTLGRMHVGSVFLGNGDGSFAPPSAYTVPVSGSVSLGDVDGDDDLDFVSARSVYASVTLGNGDGTFAPGVLYALPEPSRSAALGDVDGDRDLDIVTANYSSASVLLGNGDGSFAPPALYSGGGASVALGDVDGDRDLDIVTASYSSASVLLGNGDGSFAPRVPYALPRGARAVALGDVDGDGDLDIITAGYVGSSFSSASVLLGNGDGTFAPRVDYALPFGAASVALGDVDGDGNSDIVTASSFSAAASVLLGQGDGSFTLQGHYALPRAPGSVALGDVDGDGDPDIVTGNADSLSVLANRLR